MSDDTKFGGLERAAEFDWRFDWDVNGSFEWGFDWGFDWDAVWIILEDQMKRLYDGNGSDVFVPLTRCFLC